MSELNLSEAAAEAPAGSADGELKSALIEQLGGKRGLIDSGLPAVVFVGINGLLGAFASRQDALRGAIAASILCAVAVVINRLRRKETVQHALSGLFGLALAVFFAARSGHARDFFKPGIYLSGLAAAIFLGSVLVRRPLVGKIYGAFDGTGSAWRTVPRLRRVFSIATIAWAGVFALRAIVQAVFYNADRPDLLAISRLLMGWPLTIGAVALTVWFVRWSDRRSQGDDASNP